MSMAHTPSCVNQRCLQIVPDVLWGGGKITLVLNHSTKMIICYVPMRRNILVLLILSPVICFRFLLRRTKPDYSTSHSARLTEDVLADDRDDYDYLMQTSTVWGGSFCRLLLFVSYYVLHFKEFSFHSSYLASLF